ncbi:MAG TPA: hypothetical protein VM573_00825 [Actinomycetota bacterium]|jgi:hypothetical protein|nr:hypothetical protein [Actinomycetota bacterium]
MSQPSFFDVPRARNSIRNGKLRRDPEESFAAARSLSDEYVTHLQGLIVATLRISGPLTDEELVERIRDYYDDAPPSDSSIRTRRAEVAREGLITRAGTSETTRGRACALWRAV